MDTTRPDNAITDADDATWQAIIDTIVAQGSHDADPPEFASTLEARLAAVPGPTLVATLSQVDPSTLSRDDALIYLQASERAMTWLEGRQTDALAAIATRSARLAPSP